MAGTRFHDLRHFFASQLIAQGETAAYVRDQMGHSSIKVTFDTYGHLFPGRGKEASARYEKSMADAKVRHKAEASVSNPLAIDWGFRRRRTVIPGGTRTAFRAEGEQFTERSDAGSLIVQEVFAFVKENHPERSGGRQPLAEKGVRGKGRQPLSPLSAPETGER